MLCGVDGIFEGKDPEVLCVPQGKKKEKKNWLLPGITMHVLSNPTLLFASVTVRTGERGQLHDDLHVIA